MNLSLPQIFTLSLVYLTVLFGSAYATERGWIPRSISHNRLTRVISLGVFAGALSFYGTLGLAADFGASFMLYYFGASAVFILAPILLNPLARIALARKLGSLADVFAFRYPRPWVGSLVSLLMLTGCIPLLALQIQAVVDTVHLINQDISRDGLAIIFCSVIAIFSILFGARHASTRDKHDGLVFAFALESTLKLLAFIAIAIYAIYSVFGGLTQLNDWLQANQLLQAEFDTELSEGSSRMMLLTFFAGAIAMPHMFHILLTENDDARVIQTARWGFPVYMLLMSLCVAPILWAAQYLQIDTPAEFFALGLGLAQQNNFIILIAFIGGFAACSGVLIALTLALATMSVNHLVLPVYRVSEDKDFFSFLLNTRRTFIVAIILMSYGLYIMFDAQQNLMSLGLVSLIAMLQFIPGLVAAFYWRGANSYGLLAGLVAGFVFWSIILLFPLLIDIVASTTLNRQPRFSSNPDIWYLGSIVSFLANAIAFVVFSRFTSQTREETIAADQCMSDSPIGPYQGELSVNSVTEIRRQLTLGIGEPAAVAQITLGLQDLGLQEQELRPFALVQLRNQLESNLTSIVGQTIAHRIFSDYLPFKTLLPGQEFTESLQSLESRFELNKSHLTGLAAELDTLRRYHRQLLQDLPTAVCTMDETGRILTWNTAMTELTQISPETVLDHSYGRLPEHWADLFSEFIQERANDLIKTEVSSYNQNLTLNLHKRLTDTGDILIVIENTTEEQTLTQQLMHNQRLAAIGQLAAGVAHEVGNPVTGIACLAQNIPIETQDPELLDISSQILEQTERISVIVNSLVNFAHRGTDASRLNSEPIKLKPCIDEAIYLLSLSEESDHITFRNQVTANRYVMGDSQRLLQVFVNLLSNARDASPQQGTVTVDAQTLAQRERITISDQGIGISEKDKIAIFEPFYTTKDPGKGTGLGLAIVATIIEEHGGSIHAEPNHPNGTTVCVELRSAPSDLSLQTVDSEQHS